MLSTNTEHQQRNPCISSHFLFIHSHFPRREKRRENVSPCEGCMVTLRPSFQLDHSHSISGLHCVKWEDIPMLWPLLGPPISICSWPGLCPCPVACHHKSNQYLFEDQGKNLRMCRRFSRDQTWEPEILTSLTLFQREFFLWIFKEAPVMKLCSKDTLSQLHYFWVDAAWWEVSMVGEKMCFHLCFSLQYCFSSWRSETKNGRAGII